MPKGFGGVSAHQPSASAHDRGCAAEGTFMFQVWFWIDLVPVHSSSWETGCGVNGGVRLQLSKLVT